MCIHVSIGDEFQISQSEHDFISGTWICPPLAAFPIFNLDASSSVIYNLYGWDIQPRHQPIENIRSRQLVSYPFILLSMI
jgi:hypothetical protein